MKMGLKGFLMLLAMFSVGILVGIWLGFWASVLLIVVVVVGTKIYLTNIKKSSSEGYGGIFYVLMGIVISVGLLLGGAVGSFVKRILGFFLGWLF
ncbi:hypothetical protein M0P65_02710 [Candidatus Gracilibacteria bacterium]|nr:hypothetical protein [Candidatus Gracilibacteria bacterium]